MNLTEVPKKTKLSPILLELSPFGPFFKTITQIPSDPIWTVFTVGPFFKISLKHHFHRYFKPSFYSCSSHMKITHNLIANILYQSYIKDPYFSSGTPIPFPAWSDRKIVPLYVWDYCVRAALN